MKKKYTKKSRKHFKKKSRKNLRKKSRKDFRKRTNKLKKMKGGGRQMMSSRTPTRKPTTGPEWWRPFATRAQIMPTDLAATFVPPEHVQGGEEGVTVAVEIVNATEENVASEEERMRVEEAASRQTLAEDRQEVEVEAELARIVERAEEMDMVRSRLSQLEEEQAKAKAKVSRINVDEWMDTRRHIIDEDDFDKFRTKFEKYLSENPGLTRVALQNRPLYYDMHHGWDAYGASFISSRTYWLWPNGDKDNMVPISIDVIRHSRYGY